MTTFIVVPKRTGIRGSSFAGQSQYYMTATTTIRDLEEAICVALYYLWKDHDPKRRTVAPRKIIKFLGLPTNTIPIVNEILNRMWDLDDERVVPTPDKRSWELHGSE